MLQTKLFPSRQFTLMLRRHLVAWKPGETIDEAVRWCCETGVGEIIWKIDCEDFSHGFTPHKFIRKILPWLEKARQKCNENGLVFSINPWVALNHAARGRYPDGPPAEFHWRVHPDGKVAAELACPLSEGWRGWFFEAYRLYASVKPDKLWVEDEFKTFIGRSVELGCYCEAHIKAFAAKLGQPIDRAELVERLTRPGQPDPVRREWFDFQGGIMVDVCRELERVVHAESPTTQLGQMESWSTDGRWWSESITALAGPLKPLARTSLAGYSEGHATDFLPDRFDILKEMACLPNGTENFPELECHPHGVYNKSARTTRLQMAVAAVLGNPGITMNIFDFVGTKLSSYPRLTRMLKEVGPQLDGIASAIATGGVRRGAAIPFPKRYADSVHVEGDAGFDAFAFDGDGWAVPLQGSGLPVVLNAEERITAVTGQSLRTLPKQEIEKLLGGGLLLDGSAATVLHELDFGQHIGVEPGNMIKRYDTLLAAERDDWNGVVPAAEATYLPLYDMADRFAPLKCLDGAKPVSTFVNPDHADVMPGMVLYENDLGGRVATYPFDLSGGIRAGFMNCHRREQLQRVVRWLGCDSITMQADGGAWMMPVRWDCNGYVVLAVLNFETDPWDEIELRFDYKDVAENPRVDMMNSQGRFDEVTPTLLNTDENKVHLKLSRLIEPMDFIVLVVHKE